MFASTCRAVFCFQKSISRPVQYKVVNAYFNFGVHNLCNVPSYITPRLAKHFATSTKEKLTALQAIKRPTKKKKLLLGDAAKVGQWDVVAFSTAEEYDLERVVQGLIKEGLYHTTTLSKDLGNTGDVVHATAKYEVGTEPREIFLFREGSAVLWNIPELEQQNVLKFLKKFEQGSHPEKLVMNESEAMNYRHSNDGTQTQITDDEIVLCTEGDAKLEKYTISNGMALSVKLGTWEATLNSYIESMELVTDDLKTGRKIKMSREEVLRKTGELFSLRHVINLTSDLLDTPDFYWDRENLERLYQLTCTYYCISRRTKVMNEKLNHCVELVELLSSHLSDAHHVRLEWMIIVLIMVEVVFEVLHYMDRAVDHSKSMHKAPWQEHNLGALST